MLIPDLPGPAPDGDQQEPLQRMLVRLGPRRRPEPPSDPDARAAWAERIELDAEAHMEQMLLDAEERAEQGL